MAKNTPKLLTNVEIWQELISENHIELSLAVFEWCINNSQEIINFLVHFT